MNDSQREKLFEYVWGVADKEKYMGMNAAESSAFQTRLENDPELRRIAGVKIERNYIKDTILNQYGKEQRYIHRSDVVTSVKGLLEESIIGATEDIKKGVFYINQPVSGVHNVPATSASIKTWGIAIQRLAEIDGSKKLIILTCANMDYPASELEATRSLVEKLGFFCCIVRPAKYAIHISDLATDVAHMVLPTIESNIAVIPKPFLILAGISGTGKTRWVRKIAERTGDGTSNLRLISVRPDWHEPSDLLGYVSRVSGETKFVSNPFLSFMVNAWENAWGVQASLTTAAESVGAMTPHWVGLDEMNLAPVEQYFADYLSVLESRSWDGGTYACDPLLSFEGRGADELEAIRVALFRMEPDAAASALWDAFLKAPKPGVPLPPNLIVVGTVNMDETTHAFSRKVLDRAFTVEFDPERICSTYEDGEAIDQVLGIPKDVPVSATDVLSTVSSGKGVAEPVKKQVMLLIDTWNAIMDETPFRVAYRTLNEGLLHAASKHAAETDEAKKDEAIARALDDLLMMKLLPRLEGDADKLSCDEVVLPKDNPFPTEVRNSLLAGLWTRLPHLLGTAWGTVDAPCKSRKKLHYMAKRLARTGYTSFWP